MADEPSAGDAQRLPEEESCVPCAYREQVATFIERYAERLVAGPAVREFSAPINRNRYDAGAAAEIRTALRSCAQAVRAGVDVPEADWPTLDQHRLLGDLRGLRSHHAWTRDNIGQPGCEVRKAAAEYVATIDAALAALSGEATL